MRAKMQVYSITEYPWARDAELHAVTSGTPEDNTFAEATPAAKLNIMITAKGAQHFFKVGKSYYLDFSEAPE